MELVAKRKFFASRPPRGEWVIAIAEQVGPDELVILTVGCELTLAAAEEWERETVRLILETGNREASAPDYYDRKRG